MFAARALARRAAQTPALSAASARPLATTPQRTFVSKISRYEGMSDYMSLQQMQLIRDRLSADACGVGTVVSSDTFFYMCKRAAADLGVTDDALKKLISKIDENGDDQIQFAEWRAVWKSTSGSRRWRGVSHFTSAQVPGLHYKQRGEAARHAHGPGQSVCYSRATQGRQGRRRLGGLHRHIFHDGALHVLRLRSYGRGDPGPHRQDRRQRCGGRVRTAASTACWWGSSSNSPVYLRTGDRMIQKEEFDDFVKELIGV